MMDRAPVLTEEEKKEACYKLFDKAFKSVPDEVKKDFTFDYCVSNPPYQIKSGGKNVQIYSDFWIYSWYFSIASIMIFPIGWQRSLGRASGSAKHPMMREDKKLQSVDNYYEDKKKNPIIMFPGVGTGGVNIVIRDSSSEDSNEVVFSEYGEVIDNRKDMSVVKYWSDKTDKIFQKMILWMDQQDVDSCCDFITGMNHFGVKGYFTTDKSRKEYDSCFTYYVDDSVKAWTRNSGNSKYSYHYIKKEAISIDSSNREGFDQYKLIWPKSGAYANWRSTVKLSPCEVFSDTFIGVFFDTPDEIDNFKSYFTTLLYRFLLSETATDHNAVRRVHRHCPDLSTAVNPRTGKTGWKSDWTDDDLKILFKDYLSDEDWDYIEKVALESDGGRR